MHVFPLVNGKSFIFQHNCYHLLALVRSVWTGLSVSLVCRMQYVIKVVFCPLFFGDTQSSSFVCTPFLNTHSHTPIKTHSEKRLYCTFRNHITRKIFEHAWVVHVFPHSSFSLVVVYFRYKRNFSSSELFFQPCFAIIVVVVVIALNFIFCSFVKFEMNMCEFEKKYVRMQILVK